MTEAASFPPLPPEAEFAALRDAAIGAAQQASGTLWTDYNLHDPGVTLLEQTCFALTELAYRAGLPIRDLLTDAGGRLGGRASPFLSPEVAFATAPVTEADLAAELAAQPGVARAVLTAPGRPGLYTLRVVPEEGADPELAVDAVQARFAAIRPLCTDLAEVRIAAPVAAVATGRVTLAPLADPARVAAEIHRAIAHAARTAPSGASEGHPDGMAAAVRLLPGVLEVDRLALAAPDGGPLGRILDAAGAEADTFLAVELETGADPPRLRLVQDGREVVPDPGDVRHALARLSQAPKAEDGAAASGRRAAGDTLRPGRVRRFDQVGVDATLPALYPTSPARATETGPAARQMAGYRALTDALLGALLAQVAHLPALLSADPEQRQSHWTRLPDAAMRAGLIRDADAFLSAAADFDPGDARRAQALDLLLGVHGETLSDAPETGIARYVAAPERAPAALARRARLLAALPTGQRDRGAAPDAARPSGFLARLCAHLDIAGTDPVAAGRRFATLGLRVVEEDADTPAAASLDRTVLLAEDEPATAATGDAADAAEPGRRAEAGPAPGDDPLDCLVEVVAVAAPPDPAAMLAEVPALSDGVVRPGLLATLTDPDAYLVLREAEAWRLLADPRGAVALPDLGRHDSRGDAVARANALRVTLSEAVRGAEFVALVEDIRLRGAAGDFAPWSGRLVLPGWTPRMRLQAYRRHVERTLVTLAPAHCHLRCVWLGVRDTAIFADEWLGWREDPDQGPLLRAALDRMESAT